MDVTRSPQTQILSDRGMTSSFKELEGIGRDAYDQFLKDLKGNLTRGATRARRIVFGELSRHEFLMKNIFPKSKMKLKTQFLQK